MPSRIRLIDPRDDGSWHTEWVGPVLSVELCSTESARALTDVMLFGRDIEPGANMHSAERPY